MCFFAAPVAEKTKCGVNAAIQVDLQSINKLSLPCWFQGSVFNFKSVLKAFFAAFLFAVINLTAAVAKLILSRTVFLKLNKVINGGLGDI